MPIMDAPCALLLHNLRENPHLCDRGCVQEGDRPMGSYAKILTISLLMAATGLLTVVGSARADRFDALRNDARLHHGLLAITLGRHIERTCPDLARRDLAAPKSSCVTQAGPRVSYTSEMPSKVGTPVFPVAAPVSSIRSRRISDVADMNVVVVAPAPMIFSARVCYLRSGLLSQP